MALLRDSYDCGPSYWLPLYLPGASFEKRMVPFPELIETPATRASSYPSRGLHPYEQTISGIPVG
jgi:hypothetical protein